MPRHMNLYNQQCHLEVLHQSCQVSCFPDYYLLRCCLNLFHLQNSDYLRDCSQNLHFLYLLCSHLRYHQRILPSEFSSSSCSGYSLLYQLLHPEHQPILVHNLGQNINNSLYLITQNPPHLYYNVSFEGTKIHID